jgi:hypothetical protein
MQLVGSELAWKAQALQKQNKKQKMLPQCYHSAHVNQGCRQIYEDIPGNTLLYL